MSLKILLVLPIREGSHQIFPDLGLLYLGTVLRNAGHKVTLLDCPKEKCTFSDFKTIVQQGAFDVVGFRCFSRDHNYVNYHATIVKRINPRTLTLAGGPHPSALPEIVMSSIANLDFAWSAEAEEGLPQLLELFEEHRGDINAMPQDLLEKIPGLVWRRKHRVTAQGPHLLVLDNDKNMKAGVVVNKAGAGIDLDSFQPAWDLLDLESYPDFEKRKAYSTRIWDGFFHVLTTRGCPYPCTYCNAPNLSGKKLRHRSVGHVIEELKLFKERYGAKRFSIIDDEFTLSKKYATSFCEGLIDAKLNLKWDCPNGVRMDSLYPELLQLMEAAGCDSLCVGIESGNERIQQLIKKKVTVKTIKERAAMIAGCSNIKITGYFMIGFLDETEEEIRDTINLACTLPLVRANFNVVIPIPGVELFDELLQKGRLKIENINWDTLTNDQVAFQRNHVTGKRLMQLQREAFLRFYTRPSVSWSVAKEMLTKPRMLRTGITKVKNLAWRKETYTFVPMYQREESARVAALPLAAAAIAGD